jgi:uncharacterized protein (DUF4415 family)
MNMTRMSAKQRQNYHYMADAMRRLEWDLHNHIEATSRVPEEWHEIARERAPRKKVLTTMRLDEDVLRFFKSMGAGHLPRMNEVLRTYMHARLAGVIRGAETVDYYKRRAEYHDGERPLWGDTARMLGELPEAGEEEIAAERTARVREEVKRRGIE